MEYYPSPIFRSRIYNLNPSAPIGVFDSGPGGLAVLQQVMRLMPKEDVIYIGDTARQPYGPQPVKDVRRYSEEICSFLYFQGVKIILIGCNTASVAGLESTRLLLPTIPVLGMIEPGVRAALEVSQKNRIGIWGTELTIQERAYNNKLLQENLEVEVKGVACSKLLRLAEKGQITDRILIHDLTEYYFDPLRAFNIDTLILGCTDLTCVRDIIDEVVGDDVTVVDPAREIVNEAFEILSASRALKHENSDSPKYNFLITGDNLAEFAQFSRQFLNLLDINVQKLAVDEIQNAILRKSG